MNATRPAKTAGPRDGNLRTAWGRFWFRPTDPTTLGFMRIITGLLVFYVHLAYCFDFKAFFGPDGWWNQSWANKERQESPYARLYWGWDDYKPRIHLPQLPDRRVAVFDFLKHLPADKVDREYAMEYLSFLIKRSEAVSPVSEKNFRDGLTFLKNSAGFLEEQRKEVVDEFSREEAPRPQKVPGDVLPDFFLQMSPAERLARWSQMQNLLEYFPQQSSETVYAANFNHIIEWLFEMSPQDRRELLNYLAELPNGEQGKKILDYFETWRIDPRDTYAQGKYVFSLWFHVSNPTTMWVCHGIILFVMALFTLGFCTRVTSVMTWLAALFYIHRTQHVLFGMDTMMNVLLFYMMIGPSGAALSIDRLIARYRAARAIFRAGGQPVPWAEAALAGPRPSAMANFTIRMIQIHFCFMYMAAGLSKLKGSTWWNTTATWYTIANPEFTALNYPIYESALYALAKFKPLLYLMFWGMTYFTLILEISLPFMVWTRLRPIWVCGAVFLHSGIAWTMGLTCFGLLMMTLLLSYIPASVVRERLLWPPGTGKKLTLRYSSRRQSDGRLVAFLRCFDLTGQVAPVDEGLKNPAYDAPPQLVDEQHRVYTGPDIIRQAARTLVLARLLSWLLWVPGVSLLLRRLIGVSPAAAASRAAPPVVSIAKTPAPK